jgi:hypothetical protein
LRGLFLRPVNAQGVPQTVEIAKVDVQKVAAGYRASKVIGTNVLNVTRDGKEPYTVLSIGGFLGIGTHLWSSGTTAGNSPRQQDCATGWDKGRAEDAACI